MILIKQNIKQRNVYLEKLRPLFLAHDGDIHDLILEIQKDSSKAWTYKLIEAALADLEISLGKNVVINDIIKSHRLDNTKGVYNEADVEYIYRYIAGLMHCDLPLGQVHEITREHINRTRRITYSYMKVVADMIENNTRETLSIIRLERLKNLEQDMNEAYTEYKKAKHDNFKLGWFKQYIELKRIIDGYYPHNLQMQELEDTKDEEKVSILYSLAGGKTGE